MLIELLWVIIIFLPRPFDALFDTFVNTMQERQVDWAIYDDHFDHSSLDMTQLLATFGSASLRKTDDFVKDLETRNFEDERKHLLLIQICRNSSTFFASLNQISKFEYVLDPFTDWKPKYFVVWPYIVQSAEEAKSLFVNQIMNSYAMNFSIESNTYIVINIRPPNSKMIELSFWESYLVDKNKSLCVYNQLRPMDWYDLTNKINRRGNFYGSVIRVMMADDPTYRESARFRDTADGSSKFESGTSVGLLEFISDRLNFTVTAIKGNLTVENPDGEIYGGVRQMKEDIADLCITQTPMTPRREKLIHFLQPSYLDTLRAYFIQPPASKFRDLYGMSFSRNVWFSILLTWIIVLACLHFFGWIKNRYAENDNMDEQILNESMLWVFGAACQQGWHKQPTSFSMRLVFLIGYLTGVVCFVAFSASIVSNLSVKSDPIKTFKDLRNLNFKMYVLERSTALVYIYEILSKQKDFPSFIANESVAIQNLVAQPMLTLITYPQSFSNMTKLAYSSEFLCSTISSVPLSKVPHRSAMMVQRGSPFTEFFNYEIIVMKERGINFRFAVQYLEATQFQCLDLSTAFTQSLEMADVQTAFIILAIGYQLSTLVFGVECIWKYYIWRRINNVEVYIS